MASRLAGKVAVVTGAAGGIGKAICLKFASEGAIVVLVDISDDALQEAFKSLTNQYENNHFQICGDVADSNFAEQLFKEVNAKYGSPGDVLINCAGIHQSCLLMEETEQSFDETIQVNLKGTFVMTKAFTTALKTEDGMRKASIVNISSIIAKTGYVMNATYCAAKAGVIGFTKAVGIELGCFGIRCNAILPGIINTRMIDVMDEEARQKHCEITPLRRLGRPEDVANACLYLASDDSSFVTCSCLEVTGGWLA